jgi:hypothetical protein
MKGPQAVAKSILNFKRPETNTERQWILNKTHDKDGELANDKLSIDSVISSFG